MPPSAVSMNITRIRKELNRERTEQEEREGRVQELSAVNVV
jgi:hypothetical protein